MAARLDEIQRLMGEHPDLPPEAVFKEDLLRSGIAFSRAALDLAAGVKRKSYFIFSFDLVPLRDMRRQEDLKAPEEIRLYGGAFDFRPVVVSVRLNPASAYGVDLDQEGRPALFLEGEEIARVELPPVPDYYRRTLPGGKSVAEIAPTIEWGYLIYLTVFRMCQYVGPRQECAFCDINANFRQRRRAGRPYTGVKSVEEVLEALEIIAETDATSRAYTVTGGSITGTLAGQGEAEFYARYPEAIERRFPGRWLSKLVVQALPRRDLERFRAAGVQIYHPNYEVWERRLFERICPGKARQVGWKRWMERILEAARIFGPESVIPNFVAGIEMARPHGFRSVEEALDSTTEGLEFFMSHGIVPRFTTWCPEPTTPLGRDNPRGAPLEYHVGLLGRWRATLERYHLAPPRGYGEPGIGRAVFSVSSFMDVIRQERPGEAPRECIYSN